jgi:hypothetical protein
MSEVPKIKTKRTITADREKHGLLEQVVAFKGMLGMTGRDWYSYFADVLINNVVYWTLVGLDKRLPYVYARAWKDKHGNWSHGTGNTGGHNELGMSYAHWALYEAAIVDEINLSDAPDFQGVMGKRILIGDIGRCSPAAFAEGLRLLHAHDIWVSVLDAETQLIIEPAYNICEWLMLEANRSLETLDGTPRREGSLSEEEVNRIFYCKRCGKWTITEKSRAKMMGRKDLSSSVQLNLFLDL